jgi:hypothetical protein
LAATPFLTLIAFVSLALVAVFAYRWWRGEERVVRARLDHLAQALSPPAGGGGLAIVGRIAELRTYFAPDVTVRAGGQEVVSRDALLALLGRWEPPAKGFRVEFVDVGVTLGESDRADVTLTAMITNTDAASSEPIVDAREAHLTMRKLDGEWVLATVETTDTLRGP